MEQIKKLKLSKRNIFLKNLCKKDTYLFRGQVYVSVHVPTLGLPKSEMCLFVLVLRGSSDHKEKKQTKKKTISKSNRKNNSIKFNKLIKKKKKGWTLIADFNLDPVPGRLNYLFKL